MLNRIIVSFIIATPVFAALFFSTLPRAVFDLPKITMVYILILFIIGLWMFSGKTIKSSPFNLPILAYIAISIVATMFAVSPYTAIFGFYKRYDSILSLSCYIILFYAILTFIKKSHIEPILDIIIGSSVAACMYGYYQSWGYDFVKWSLDFGLGIRPQSTLGHPGFFACFLAMVVPIAIYKIYTNRFYYLYLLILALMIYMIYETKTRASLVALAVFTIIYLVMITYNPAGRDCRHMWKSKLTVFILLIVISISVYQNAFVEYTAISRFREDIEKIRQQEEVRAVGSTRLKIWQTGLRIIKNYPYLGIGPDNIAFAYEPYFQDERKIGFQYQTRLHNDILEQAATRGIPGLLIWLWLMVSIGRHVVSSIRLSNNNKFLIIMLASVMLIYVVNNQFSFGTIGTTTMFWFVLGLMVVVSRAEFCPYIKEAYRIRIPLVKVGISMVLVLFLFLALKFYYADIYYRGYAVFKNRAQKTEDEAVKRDYSQKSYFMLGAAMNHNPHEPVYMRKFQMHFIEQMYLEKARGN